MLVAVDTGEVIAYTSPKFQDLTYEDYVEQGLKYLAVQEATALDNVKLQQFIREKDLLAEIKFDGHRGMTQLRPEGNRIFSRRIAKETDWYAENTDQLPQIRDLKIPEDLIGTVIDAEVLIDSPECTCRMVQSITGALPSKAISWQLDNKFAHLQVFDILFYKGYRLTAMPLWKRKIFLANVVERINSPFIRLGTMYTTDDTFIELCEEYVSTGVKFNPFKDVKLDYLKEHVVHVEDFQELYKSVLEQGKEGLMLKTLNGTYEHKRAKNYIKMKPNLTFDVVIMGYIEPEHYFNGKTLDEGGTWDYWEDAEDESLIYTNSFTADEADEKGLLAVTKFYANDWIGAVKFGVYKYFTWEELTKTFGAVGVDTMLINGKLVDESLEGARLLVEVGQTSGMSDATRAIISENKNSYIGTVIEVEAQCIINPQTGSLQHPRFKQFRPDKNAEACKFEDHLIAGGI